MRSLRWLFPVVLPLLALGPAYGQHAQTRLQWQPQTENDARLQQSVRTEILGRAAITGLPILSERTGVKLTVAPEDAETLGERKFTLIAQGVDLKSVMVRLAEALQECHWDVEVGGEQPVYLLHREPGAAEAAGQEEAALGAEGAAEARTLRAARLEEAQRALRMSPEELAELAKTDPFLAYAVKDPHARVLLEALLSLPAEQLEKFRDSGRANFIYDAAAPALQRAAEVAMAWGLEEEERRPPTRTAELFTPMESREEDLSLKTGVLTQMKRWREQPSRVVLGIDDEGLDFGFGVRLIVKVPIGSSTFGVNDAILPPRKVSTDEGSGAYLRMLMGAGAAPDPEAAMALVQQIERKGFEEYRERAEARHRKEWVTPTDPDLLQVVKLPAEAGETAILQAIAAQSGLSIASDYFTGRRLFVTEEMQQGLPLWKLLYTLGGEDSGGQEYPWKKVGPVLVLHARHWPALARQEVPESLLLAYQEKLQQQGRFTLDDLAAFAVALGEGGAPYRPMPTGLVRAGLGTAAAAGLGLRCYATLSPQQVAQARREVGLPYAEMSIAQRQMVAKMAGKCDPPLPRPTEAVRQGVFRITEETKQRKRGEVALAITTVTFTVQFGETKYQDFAALVAPAEAKKAE